MVHNQEWADPMVAMIILVAILERTTWKYHDPNAYRVVLIEAGHIAQNIMLACTERGLWQRLVDGIKPPLTRQQMTQTFFELYRQQIDQLPIIAPDKVESIVPRARKRPRMPVRDHERPEVVEERA